MEAQTSSCSTGSRCNIMHSPALPSSSSRPLSALFVFRSILNQELIRSLHGYQVSEEEEEWVEREFLFSPSSCIEMRDPIPGPIMVASTAGDGGNGFRYRFKEGQSVGLWRCILAFDSTVAFSASSSPIPPLLCLSRNPRLKNIPTLLGDLQEAFQLRCEMETKNTISLASKGIQVREGKEPHDTAEYADTGYEDGSSDSCSTIRHVKLRNQKNHRTLQELAISMKKKKRAATEHVANIALTDLVKYFDLPITEASKYLRVGLTVLKRKCREFGIPRWPHRKIKSLDNLIQNLQEEVHRQEKENKSAAMKAVIKRQRMLEGEKECIEKNPFMELQIETKRFRQDVFKRRHRAKALVGILGSDTNFGSVTRTRWPTRRIIPSSFLHLKHPTWWDADRGIGIAVTRGIMVGGLFLSLGRPTRQQQKACIARSGDFNYDPKFHGASSPLRSSLGDNVVVEEEALSKSGFFVNRARVLLGAGPRTFDLAKSALLSWKHFELGWTFVDPETPVEKGERLCVCVKEVIPWLMMPLQIAYVRDEISGRGPTKASFGFGSGTLQGHLLAGEERFSIERDENDEVWYEIYSFSKPAHFLSMVGYPYVKLRQQFFAHRSADALKKHVAMKQQCAVGE
ncbi:unnamed protein product [Musa hybrid cultivar]